MPQKKHVVESADSIPLAHKSVRIIVRKRFYLTSKGAGYIHRFGAAFNKKLDSGRAWGLRRQSQLGEERSI